MNKLYTTISLCLMILLSAGMQLIAVEDKKPKKTDANIVGHVTCNGEHVPFASIVIEGTTIGASTDESGHFMLTNLPLGQFNIRVQAVGYSSVVKSVETVKNKTLEINFEIKEDNIGLEAVVVSANRNEKNRKESMTVVNSITPELFERTSAVTLSEGLKFTPGLRLENNCQNCGFTQVRMNGMEGPYSQILINSRPIFSGLAGVYGLELIPSNMIERVEVVRGGGSALYGSNAIAGTINIITKDPLRNTYQASGTLGSIGVLTDGNSATDYNVNFNASAVSSNFKSGLSLFGFYRDRQPYDANNDEFSELGLIENATLGFRGYHNTGNRSKFTLDYFHIDEERRGGNKFDLPPHDADIAEAVEHSINTSALTWEKFSGISNKLSLFASLQHINRDSYYGAEQDSTAFGETKNLTYSLGAQYVHNFENLLFAPAQLITGIENNGDFLKDYKLGYIGPGAEDEFERTLISDQKVNITGAFAQSEWSLDKLKLSVGLRFDHYQIINLADEPSETSGNVILPRASIMYDINSTLQLRGSFSKGYRAPQIFDEDLHILSSGARKVIYRNDPDLTQEDSHSLSASLNWTPNLEKGQLEFLAEGFYTRLKNPFVSIIGEPDENGIVIYTRTNAEDGASVSGINFELNTAIGSKLEIQSGFTFQQSRYDEPQENFNERRFFRTPDDYGYVTLNWDLMPRLGLACTANYTGKMLIPYFGPSIEDPDDGELRTSKQFFDAGTKLTYDIPLGSSINMQIYGDIRNIFNSYQDDFDTGIERDPGYIYGPILPRTISFGIKIGNIY